MHLYIFYIIEMLIALFCYLQERKRRKGELRKVQSQIFQEMH